MSDIYTRFLHCIQSSFILFAFLFTLLSCEVLEPTGFVLVDTKEPVSILANSAVLQGETNQDGMLCNIVNRGFEWGLSASLEQAEKVGLELNDNVMNLSLTSLKPNTKYYYRAYAVDGQGNHYYGKIESFTTGGCNNSIMDMIISTIAGNGTPHNDGDAGLATEAGLNWPYDIAVDKSGNIFIADKYNSSIRKISADNGKISTVARFSHPTGVALDESGNIYASSEFEHKIFKINASDGAVSVVAGNGTAGYSGDGGPATSASIQTLHSVTVDKFGNIYISDKGNYRIRKVSASDGRITTIAGNGTGGRSTGDGGLAIKAGLQGPTGIAVDHYGNIYFAEHSNHIVRKIDATTGIISTIAGINTSEGTGKAGSNGDGGPATSAGLAMPYGVAVDVAGNIFIADVGNHRIRKVSICDGTISTVTGTGNAGFSGDGGAATSATLNGPYGVKFDAAGNMYVADGFNHRIRKVKLTSSK